MIGSFKLVSVRGLACELAGRSNYSKVLSPVTSGEWWNGVCAIDKLKVQYSDFVAFPNEVPISHVVRLLANYRIST